MAFARKKFEKFENSKFFQNFREFWPQKNEMANFFLHSFEHFIQFFLEKKLIFTPLTLFIYKIARFLENMAKIIFLRPKDGIKISDFFVKISDFSTKPLVLRQKLPILGKNAYRFPR